MHKPVKRNFARRHVLVNEIDDVWGADLVEMQEWKTVNKGYRYMLTVIDCFSKFAWSIPLKDKTGLVVLDAFKKIIKESDRQPNFIWVDQGKEFYNKHFDQWLKEKNIIRYSTFGPHKSAIVERFNRTLKENMWKRFTAENTRNWINTIDQLMKEYNNKIHSATNMTPTEASEKKNEAEVNNYNRYTLISKSKAKFEVGDIVRISRTKALFEKGYLPNWSEEIFTIDKVQKTQPVTYVIKDTAGEIIKGSFYNEELQQTSQQVFRIEKIIMKKKIDGVQHGLVKGMGYNKKFNQWLPLKDFI